MNIFILGLLCLLVEVAAVVNNAETVSVGTEIEVVPGNPEGEAPVISETPVANPAVILPKPSLLQRLIRRTGRRVKRELRRSARSLRMRAKTLERRARRMTDETEIARLQEQKQEFSAASQSLGKLSKQLVTFFKTENGLEELLNKISPPVEETKKSLKINDDPLTKLINELQLHT